MGSTIHGEYGGYVLRMQASLPGRGCPGPARPVSTLRYSSGQVGCRGIIATKREPEGREAAGCDVNAAGKFENGHTVPGDGLRPYWDPGAVL